MCSMRNPRSPRPDRARATATLSAQQPGTGVRQEVVHDLPVAGFYLSPHLSHYGVVQPDQGAEQERIRLAAEEQLARHPDAAAGAQQRDIRGAEADLPAEYAVWLR